jgi:hypothetical protein
LLFLGNFYVSLLPIRLILLILLEFFSKLSIPKKVKFKLKEKKNP